MQKKYNLINVGVPFKWYVFRRGMQTGARRGVGSAGTETGTGNAAYVRAFYLPPSSTIRARLIKQGIFMIYTISRAENTINVGTQINGAAGHAATSLFRLRNEHSAVLY